MARLSRAESQQLTRMRLIEAASTCFADRGFHGTTIEAVVTESGHSRGAFYSNFSNLDELFLAVLDHRMEQERVEISTILSKSTSARHLVELLHKRRVTSPADPTWQTLLAEFRLHALRDGQLRPLLALREQRLRAHYRTGVDAVLGGDSTGLDHDLLALVLQVVEDGIAYHRELEPEQVPSGTFIEALELLMLAVGALVERADR